MYKFRDVNETIEDDELPAEAMKINGEYIENLVQGYKTLNVSGRELLGNNITTNDIETINGAIYVKKKKPVRVITINYQLITNNDNEFREKYNKLSKILNVENAQLIFEDEPDKYFIGTPQDMEEVDPGLNQITSKFNIVCTNPHKYSLVTKTFNATLNDDGIMEAIVENNGNAPCDIDYNLKMNSENGFVGIVGDNGVLQYGFADETDYGTFERSETLINISGQTDFGTKMLNCVPNGYEYNGQRYYARFNDPNFDSQVYWKGELTAYNYRNEYGSKTWNCLKLKNWKPLPAGWPSNRSGASILFPVPKTTAGTNPKNFVVETRAWLSCGTPNQTGCNFMYAYDTNGNSLCGMLWADTSTGSHAGEAQYYFFHGVKTQVITLSTDVNGGAGIKPRVNGGGTVMLKKQGKTITINFMGTVKTVNIDGIENLELGTVQLGFLQFANLGTPIVTRMDILNYFKVIANNVQYYEDVPNRYAQGDEIYIDGKENVMYKNGAQNYDDEILGSTYFKAEPGNNKIFFSNSTWAEPIDASATIRERWI